MKFNYLIKKFFYLNITLKNAIVQRAFNVLSLSKFRGRRQQVFKSQAIARQSPPTRVHHFSLERDPPFPPSFLHPNSFRLKGLMGTVDAANKDVNVSLADKKPTVVFVLGGPGSGKGTQCANIVEHFHYTHLSAGDLLRAEIKSGSENGYDIHTCLQKLDITMIQNMIKEGKIVPSEVTIRLLQKAMLESGNDKFLIDGFPRNEENRAAFEAVTKIEPEFVLFFNCPEEEMERRLLSRNQGREDDNIETIRKRFMVFLQSSLPVIEYYKAKGKVREVTA
ncbi:UMP-CMP kinase 3-like isoform X2 [Durio zibethinus]|uniref:adenylate kinase n=1 Tax=Durio zibethinus TaxID=66656 RepID=A0A6P5YQK9_DURZI|nr:UMP-CMP kinase 3-like isoform X2 [Durio zibethinus]